MGRSAGKFESIEETLMNLERKACALAELGQGYVRFEEEVMKSGAVSTDSGVVVGHCPTTEMSTFKPVDPERISFVGQPKFRAEEYLDPKGREVFLDPLKCRDDPDSFQGTIPRVRVHCSLSQKVRLFELLDASQRLHLWLPHEVDLRYGAGMFCVVKSLKKDRLILDSRPGNLLEKPLSRWIKSLASGDALLRLVLEQDECVLASGNDVRDFYHLFSVSTARSKTELPGGDFGFETSWTPFVHKTSPTMCWEASGVFSHACHGRLAGRRTSSDLSPFDGPQSWSLPIRRAYHPQPAFAADEHAGRSPH